MITTGTLDFRDALPEGGALMALDLGTQTIGTAFCDAGWNFATPGKYHLPLLVLNFFSISRRVPSRSPPLGNWTTTVFCVPPSFRSV